MMNQKVENLINQEKDRLEKYRNQMRNNHLKSLGLFEDKMERVYLDYNDGSAKIDEETKKYYIENPIVLEVTDEEYNEICKYFPPVEKEIKVDFSGSGVKTLEGFGKFFFFIASISIIVALVGLFMYLSNIESYSGGDTAMKGISLASSFFPISIGSFACGAISLGLSTITKTALFKRHLLEKQYTFVE